MLNLDVYLKNPKEFRILNQGVAKVSDDESVEELKTLRFELETFVCEGTYEKGLEKILYSFLQNLNQPEQRGVWVSGFFGSGKSHLVKMLKALWVDTRFPKDGATARGLAKIPDSIKELLKELDTAGKRGGGLHAASGTLGQGASDNVRLTLLGIIFKSAGLPEEYPQARLVMRLRDEGNLENVRSLVEKSGKIWEKELRNMYVSPYLAKALAQEAPGFPKSEEKIRGVLKEQFPNVDDVSENQMIDAIYDSLSRGNQFPLAMIVLDEVQQYIGENSDRTYRIQETVEACCEKFGGKMLFVATGQTALSGTPMLQKLMGRFQIPIELSDKDVEEVVRKVILVKKPEAIPELDKTLNDHLGEISRHLQGTKIAHRMEDMEVFVADYPLLPVRRRFWEYSLRSVDQAGTSAQLRNQLKVVHEATRVTADKKVGTVVSTDFIFDEIAPQLLQTGVLPREIYTRIIELKSGSEEDILKARLCSTVFLISKLPRDPGVDLGIRATDSVLADLLVEDLHKGSTDLRKRIPSLLKALEKDGILMKVDSEYRLQTREGSAWNDVYRQQMSKFLGDPNQLAAERGELFRKETRERLRGIHLIQGRSKEHRTLLEHFGPEPPEDQDKKIYVWIRDGWDTDEKTVLNEARSVGSNSPTIFIYIRRSLAEDLKNILASLRAAEATLEIRGVPNTAEGHEARNSVITRKTEAESKLRSVLDDIFDGTAVFQGGGQEVSGLTLVGKIEEVAENSMIRLYPNFDIADNENWGKVVERAKKGDGAALEAVGHTGDADKHPVCKAILREIGPGKKGSEVRAIFEGSHFGWPRDAVDGALYILLATGYLQATDINHKPVEAISLERSQIGKTSFKIESATVTPQQKLKIRKLLQELNLPCRAGEELIGAQRILETMQELAYSAGGEPPRPDYPSTKYLSELSTLTGNELIIVLAERQKGLLEDINSWKEVKGKIVKRLPRWENLNILLSHAKSLPDADEVQKQAEAICTQRQLLNDSDPIPNLCEKITQILRIALNQAQSDYKVIQDREKKSLESDLTWKKLSANQRSEMLTNFSITEPPSIRTGSEAEIITSLEEMPLTTWYDRCEALPERFKRAREAVAKLLEPKAKCVSLPSRTLHNKEDTEVWLKEAKEEIEKGLKEGPVIV